MLCYSLKLFYRVAKLTWKTLVFTINLLFKCLIKYHFYSNKCPLSKAGTNACKIGFWMPIFHIYAQKCLKNIIFGTCELHNKYGTCYKILKFLLFDTKHNMCGEPGEQGFPSNMTTRLISWPLGQNKETQWWTATEKTPFRMVRELGA